MALPVSGSEPWFIMCSGQGEGVFTTDPFPGIATIMLYKIVSLLSLARLTAQYEYVAQN